jgi:hypothetical protein
MNKDYPNLISAVESCTWKPPVIEYRVYYDKTGTITTKTINSLPGDYIVVSEEIYNNMVMHTQWHVINGQVEIRPVVEIPRHMLQCTAEGPYRSLPGNAVFLVDDDYAGSTDNWTI